MSRNVEPAYCSATQKKKKTTFKISQDVFVAAVVGGSDLWTHLDRYHDCYWS